jgi:hypothetical protein
MNTYILTTSDQVDAKDYNTIQRRLGNMAHLELNRNVALIFDEAHPPAFAESLFEGVKPHPDIRLVLASDTAFFPK